MATSTSRMLPCFDNTVSNIRCFAYSTQGLVFGERSKYHFEMIKVSELYGLMYESTNRREWLRNYGDDEASYNRQVPQHLHRTQTQHRGDVTQFLTLSIGAKQNYIASALIQYICLTFTSFPHFEQRPDPFLWHFFLFSMCSMVASSCIILLTTHPDCNVCRFCMRPIFVYNMFNSLVYISSIRAISCCMWNWISLAIYCLPPSTLHTTPFALFSRHEVR